MVDVVGQIGAAALLTAFDDDDDAPVRDALLLQGTHRRQRCEGGIAVVGAATPIQLVALADGDPRTIAVPPARHLGLLVVVAVHEDGVVALAFDLDEQEWCAIFEAHDLDLGAVDLLGPTPGLDELDGLVHVTGAAPRGVEQWRFVGDLDVIGELGNDGVLPDAIDELLHALVIHGGGPPGGVS